MHRCISPRSLTSLNVTGARKRNGLRLVTLQIVTNGEQDVTNLRQTLKELEARRNRVRQELLRVDAAIDALRNLNHFGRLVKRRKPIRTLSVAARSRIAAAQRARWARWKAQQKSTA